MSVSKLDPRDETYRDISPLIKSLAYRFHRLYARDLDLDDVISEANLAFVKAYNKYDHTKGSFGRRVRFVVWHYLIDNLRVKTRRHIPIKHGMGDNDIADREIVNLNKLQVELSDDSSKILDKILEIIEDDNKIYKNKIKITHILEYLGWTSSQIKKFFKEIKELLILQCQQSHFRTNSKV